MNSTPKHILFFFVDGIGIGENDPRTNPCADPQWRFFNHTLVDSYPKSLPCNGYAFGLDANLDTPGLPQSATGQTALFTGVNASQLIGRHLNHKPNEQLREVIREQSIFQRLKERGKSFAFLNAFRPPFFDYPTEELIRHLSVTSCMNHYAGGKFFDLEDLLARKCVYQDMTGDALREKGFDAPVYTPADAGRIIGEQVGEYDLCLYEYFQTDFSGHSMDMERARGELAKLDAFMSALLETVDLSDTLVLLTSDHGNIEDLSFKGHTRNPAMTLVFGAGRERLLKTVGIMEVSVVLENMLVG